MKHPVQDVLKAEQEAVKIAEKAEQKRQSIITKAKQESIALLATEEKKIDAEQQKRVDGAKLGLAKKVASIREKAQDDVMKLKRSASKNVDKVSEFVLAELDKRME